MNIKFLIPLLLISTSTMHATTFSLSALCPQKQCEPAEASGLKLAIIDFDVTSLRFLDLFGVGKQQAFCPGTIKTYPEGISNHCAEITFQQILDKGLEGCWVHGDRFGRLTKETLDHNWGLAIVSDWGTGGFHAGLSHTNVYPNPVAFISGAFFLPLGTVTVTSPQYSFKLTDTIEFKARTTAMWNRKTGMYSEKIYTLEIWRKRFGEKVSKPVPMIDLNDPDTGKRFDEINLSASPIDWIGPYAS